MRLQIIDPGVLFETKAKYATPMALITAYCKQDSLIIVGSLKKLSTELKAVGFYLNIKHSITASTIAFKL